MELVKNESKNQILSVQRMNTSRMETPMKSERVSKVKMQRITVMTNVFKMMVIMNHP